MSHILEVRADQKDYGMKFIERIEPSLASGTLSVNVTQEVEIEKEDGSKVTDTLTASKKFAVRSRAFTLAEEDVYSVSPGDNTHGNFSNQLPHITFKRRTLPWEYKTGEGEPWLALLTVTDKEYSDKDITIEELLQNKEERVYFPVQAQPDCYLEQDSDLCHVIDLSRELFLGIAPRKGECTLLAHGKFLDLLDKSDESVEMDGYFSTIIGGRFVPSESGEAVKSTIHLVSMLGYSDLDSIPDTYEKVRLVSLYRWGVYSVSEEKAGFCELMEGIDSGVMQLEGENEWLRHGYVPKRHLFRSGENAVSLYRGPLVPYPVPKLSVWEDNLPATADGALIFDRKEALFDASYSAAWQLGRLLTLQNCAVAQAIVKWRKQTETLLQKCVAVTFLRTKCEDSRSPYSLARRGVEEMLTKMGGIGKDIREEEVYEEMEE